MDRSLSFPFSVDEKGTRRDGADALPRKAFRGALTLADAYHATRTAVRIEGELLRLGNRFVPVGRFREIAFVAAGNAASSQALALVHGLGARLTQGLVASPDPPVPEIPFRTLPVPRGYPGSPEGVAAARLMLELASGLGRGDLLIVLVSGGAVASLAIPDPSRGPSEPGPWLAQLHAAGASSREIALIEAATLGGGVDGGLAEAAGSADVLPIVLDRGDGGGLVGGSPTRRLGTLEREEARAALARSDLAGTAAAGPLPRNRSPPPAPLGQVDRSVVVAGPEDALRGAADAVGEKRYLPRLARLAMEGDPATVAERFVERVEEILRAEAGALRSRDRDGLVAFASATFQVPEGIDERPAVRRFLAEARPRLRHRGSLVGAFVTSGGDHPQDPAGGFVEAGATADGEVLRLHGVPMPRGITDVGCLLLAVVPSPRS